MHDNELKENHNKKSQYFTFILKDELFCIEVSPIKEIIEYINITKVPMMQDFVKGITNVRGNIIPVIDLGKRLNLGETKIDRKTCIVIIEVRQDDYKHDMGILIDSINQVLELEDVDIEEAPNFGAKIERRFIEKMGKISNKFINILDIDTILDIKELSIIVNDQ